MKSAQRVRRSPATARLFLIATGTPANGRASPGRDRGGRGACALVIDVDERVDLRLERVDAPQRRVHELERRQLARAHERRELVRRAAA